MLTQRRHALPSFAAKRGNFAASGLFPPPTTGGYFAPMKTTSLWTLTGTALLGALTVSPTQSDPETSAPAPRPRSYHSAESRLELPADYREPVY